MYQKITYRTLYFFLIILSQSVTSTYSLEIDPSKEVLSRDKKPVENLQKINKSKSSTKETKDSAAPKFLGDVPQKLPKLDEISEDGSVEKKIEKDKSNKIPPKESKPEPTTKDRITTQIKSFLGIKRDAKKSEVISKDKDAKEEKNPKKKVKTDNSKSKKENIINSEISLDTIEASEETKPVEKVPLSSYMKYFDRMESYKTLFNLHDFNIDQDSSAVEPSSYLKLMFSIQSYTPVILNSDHHNEVSHIINTKSTDKVDFEKIFIMAQYIKMIVKLTHQNLNVTDFLYKPTLLRFPQLAEHVKQIQTNSKFSSVKEFLYLNEKFDLYIKKNDKHKIQMDNKITKILKNTFSTSSSSKYLHDNLGLITYVLFVPYISHDATIKYFIFLTAVEMDSKQNIKSVYDIYLFPHKSYTFSIDTIHDHLMLQDLSDSLQKDILKKNSTYPLDPMFKKLIKKEKDLMDYEPRRNRTNGEVEHLDRDDITSVDQRQRQEVAPKNKYGQPSEKYKKDPEPF